VGEGSERAWLRQNLERAELPGVLQGEALARAYANMDVFVFPSETDTFGNVILEALASGVPSVVSARGGPKFLVHEGVTGLVAPDFDGFAAAVIGLYRDPGKRERMRASAREAALGRSWDKVFEGVYRSYRRAFCTQEHSSTKMFSPKIHRLYTAD
jgi:glycosyltransferase involved in cell wall biosynthesis